MKFLYFMLITAVLNIAVAQDNDGIKFDRRMVAIHITNMQANIERLEEVLENTAPNEAIEHLYEDIIEFCELSQELQKQTENGIAKSDLTKAYIPMAEIADHITEVIVKSQQLYATYNITLHWKNVEWYIYRLSLHLDFDLNMIPVDDGGANDHDDDDHHDD